MSQTTLRQLREFIREEISKTLTESEQILIRKGDKLYISDDEGNRSLLGSVTDYPQYASMADGETAEYYGGAGGGGGYGYGGYGGYGRSSRRRRY